MSVFTLPSPWSPRPRLPETKGVRENRDLSYISSPLPKVWRSIGPADLPRLPEPYRFMSMKDALTALMMSTKGLWSWFPSVTLE
jgi:hypothetical protein